MILFDRQCAVTIVRTGLTGEPISTVELPALRTVFQVRVYPFPSMATATLRVYNVPETLRKGLARAQDALDAPVTPPFDTLFLYAGYKGRAGLLFRGIILTAMSYRSGADWYTDFQCTSYVGKTFGAILNKSYKNSTGLTILSDLLSTMKTDYQLINGADRILSVTLPSYIVEGSADSSLSTLLRSNGLVAAERMGTMVITPLVALTSQTASDEVSLEIVESRDVPLITPNTGLIGTPKPSNYGAVIRTLLDTRIFAFGTIAVQSQTISVATGNDGPSLYFVKSVLHRGDTHTDEWYTDIEALFPNLILRYVSFAPYSSVPISSAVVP